MEKDIGAIKQIIETSQSAGLLLEKGMGEEFFLAKGVNQDALNSLSNPVKAVIGWRRLEENKTAVKGITEKAYADE